MQTTWIFFIIKSVILNIIIINSMVFGRYSTTLAALSLENVFPTLPLLKVPHGESWSTWLFLAQAKPFKSVP